MRISAFYGRRFAKLMPVLWAYTLVISIAQHFVDLQCTTIQLLVAAFLCTGFLSTGTWYVGHFWSLTVEEVFYVSWAPVVSFLSRRAAIRVAASAALLSVVVRALNTAARSNHFSQWFQWWPHVAILCDLDAVAIGSWFALQEKPLGDRLAKLSSSARAAIVIAAWFIVLGGLSAGVDHAAHGQWVKWAMPIVHVPIAAIAIGVIVLLAHRRSTTGGRSWLESRLLVAIGRISYSVYVVQQAFCVPIQWRSHVWFQQPPWSLLCAASLGAFMFVVCEEPLRRRIVHALHFERSRGEPTLLRTQNSVPHVETRSEIKTARSEH